MYRSNWKKNRKEGKEVHEEGIEKEELM